MAQLNVADYPTKLCLGFSSGDAFDIEMKSIECGRIPSRDLSKSHFHHPILVTLDLLSLLRHLLAEAQIPFHPWTSLS